MTDLVDKAFDTNHIVIPPTLPSILKKYAKAAIKTQPYDLLVWSTAYFKAMANGTTPPVKSKYEYPPIAPSGLSTGYIKLLVNQIGKSGKINREDLEDKWKDICLPQETFYNITRLGRFFDVIDWPKFVAIAIGFLEDNLKKTMIRICEMFTEEPEGAGASIPCELFLTLYRFLAEMDCGPLDPRGSRKTTKTEEEQVMEIVKQQQEHVCAEIMDGVVGNIEKADSKVSVMTLEAGDEGWSDADVECDPSETNLITQFEESPSDEGATSAYGIEVFEETPTIIFEHAESEEHQHIEETFSVEMYPSNEVKKEKYSLYSEVFSDFQDTVSEKKISEQEEAITEEVVEPEKGSSVLSPEKEKPEAEMKQSELTLLGVQPDSPESVNNSEASVGSEQEIRPTSRLSVGEPLTQKMSLEELRFTFNTRTRKGKLVEGLTYEEQRRALEKEKEEEAAELARLRAEVDMGYWLDVPGVGPPLPEQMIASVETYLKTCCETQAGLVMPRNLRHFMCPPLNIESEEAAHQIRMLLNLAEDKEKEEEKPKEKWEPVEWKGDVLRKDSRSERVLSMEPLVEDLSEANSEVVSEGSRSSLRSPPSVGARLAMKASIVDLLFTLDKDTVNEALGKPQKKKEFNI